MKGEPIIEAKVVLVGDGGVGKTTFIQRHQTGEFDKKYNPTIGAQVSPLRFQTSRGLIVFNVWDTEGQEKSGRLDDDYYHNAQSAILMFDVTSPLTYKSVTSWHSDLVRLCQDIPIVLVGNKIDVRDRKVPKRRVCFHKRNNMRYFEISAKSNYNLELPFLSLARSLTKDPYLQFISTPALFPPEFNMDQKLIQQYENELQESDPVPLPDDEDEFLD